VERLEHERLARPRGSTVRGRIASVRGSVDLLTALTFSDLRFRYGRGPWQVVRWLFDPFAIVGIYLVLVTVVLRRGGDAAGLSLAAAVVPFQLVMLSVTNAMGALSVRRPIILNMAFPRTLIPLSSVLTESVAFAASFVLIVLMMAVYGVAPTAAIAWLPLVVAITALVAAGFAFPASLFGLWFRELRAFGLSFVRTLFFLGPGLVPLSTTGGTAAKLLRLNPMTGLFEAYRDLFLYGRSPAAWELGYPALFGLVLLAVFVPLYRSEQRQFAKVVE
jgi:lipopolysaccharide transport system permease protein